MSALTRSIGVNLFRFFIDDRKNAGERWLRALDNEYSTLHLREMLVGVADELGARVINISTEQFSPMGASAAVMIGQPESVLAHLDQSHLAVHTYPEKNDDGNEVSFRADFDLSTCGPVDPLPVAGDLVRKLAADVAVIDYRVRGIVRDDAGRIARPASPPSSFSIAGYDLRKVESAAHSVSMVFASKAAVATSRDLVDRLF